MGNAKSYEDIRARKLKMRDEQLLSFIPIFRQIIT